MPVKQKLAEDEGLNTKMFIIQNGRLVVMIQNPQYVEPHSADLSEDNDYPFITQ